MLGVCYPIRLAAKLTKKSIGSHILSISRILSIPFADSHPSPFNLTQPSTIQATTTTVNNPSPNNHVLFKDTNRPRTALELRWNHQLVVYPLATWHKRKYETLSNTATVYQVWLFQTWSNAKNIEAPPPEKIKQRRKEDGLSSSQKKGRGGGLTLRQSKTNMLETLCYKHFH